jgi:two-component system sensor histidine kinase BaeS
LSFRVRVFVLVAFVALGATVATAVLTLRQAGDQVRDAASASRETTDLIRNQLRGRAQRNGTWAGVDQTLRLLREQTGQRLRLVDVTGTVVADTDHLEGRASRPSGPVAVLVDPLPALALPAGEDPRIATLAAVDTYRSETLRAACLFGAGYELQTVEGVHGVPRHVTDPPVTPDDAARCEPASTPDEQRRLDIEAVDRCARDAVAADCLQATFRRQIAVGETAPRPLLLTLGAGNETVRVLDPGPILLITIVVAALTIGGALLISRRVLRPIGTLTTAARRLGRGDRGGRVPDGGRDELGELARAFNQMADSLRAAEDDQRRLIADVAHELRTPLANLRGYLEALQDGVMEPTPELFASLHDEVILNQRIVDDLQELALAEAGALVYHRAPIDLAELMETARTAHRAAADAAGVRLTIGNLVGNALRATATGGSVTLRALAVEDRAVLEVADTGVGIAREHLPLVFDRLWRADPARGRVTGGSGLGLAIVRQIVRDHDGEISVSSVEGAGSTFTISLPLGQPETSLLSPGASGRSTNR